VHGCTKRVSSQGIIHVINVCVRIRESNLVISVRSTMVARLICSRSGCIVFVSGSRPKVLKHMTKSLEEVLCRVKEKQM
jgi:hypothetical protein